MAESRGAPSARIGGPRSPQTPGQAWDICAGLDLSAVGYVEREYLVEGVAEAASTSLASAVPDWRACPPQNPLRPSSAFLTRILVRAPSDPSRYRGSTIAEWFNVGSASDAGLFWAYTHTELVRSGWAWIGISAQRRGIEGVPNVFGGQRPARNALRHQVSGRYAELSHPGDEYAASIFTQVTRAARERSEELVGGVCTTLLAAGVSDAASALLDLLCSEQDAADVLDGAVVEGCSLDGDEQPHRRTGTPRRPLLVVSSEHDVLMTAGGCRVEDGPTARTWEVAGASHIDTYLKYATTQESLTSNAKSLAAVFSPLGRRSLVNCGPQKHYTMCAATRTAESWARNPLEAPASFRLELVDEGGELSRDELGIARAGLRTPWVDVPLYAMSGESNRENPMVRSFGTSRLIPRDELTRRYGDAVGYQARLESALHSAVDRGVVLEEDLAEILSVAPLLHKQLTSAPDEWSGAWS